LLLGLAICGTWLHYRELLILFEPASALAVVGEALLERELDELRRERTLLVASHAPARLERFATGRLALA
jgi:ABC-type transport system involved in cytochrome bd biosynthesis fused ATPase/permease subunit